MLKKNRRKNMDKNQRYCRALLLRYEPIYIITGYYLQLYLNWQTN